MPRFVLLLRGVNVGAGNALAMAELRRIVAEAGGSHVQTYVQSGNVVFSTDRAINSLQAEVETALRHVMGRPIPTAVRSGTELSALIAANPYPEAEAEPTKLCLTFLSQVPSALELAPLFSARWAPERFYFVDREIYTHHPNGQGRSQLAATLARLPVQGALTTRNWNTVRKLADLATGA
jgi:uncharacterized protein (DUF1697 family)